MPQPIRARSRSMQALLVIALIAVLQFAVLALLTSSQRAGAHAVDVSGAQRMRTQRIALLVMLAHVGRPLPGWRAELTETLAGVAAARRELGSARDTGPALDRYVAAAERAERDPADPSAYATIATERLPLFSLLDRAVHERADTLLRWNDGLVACLLAALLAQVATIVITWRRVMEPALAGAERVLGELEESQRQFRAIFSQNPDCIAIYDMDGKIVRGNRASFALLAFSAEAALGRHYTTHVAAEERSRVDLAFADVLAGKPVSLETVFVDANGARIAVRASLFPRKAAGRVTGVIGVAKDARALKAAEAEAREQSERLAELYALSASHGSTWEQQIEETMRAVARRLGFEFGVLEELRAEQLGTIGAVGEAGVEVGNVVPLGRSLVRHALAVGSLWTVDELNGTPYADDAPDLEHPWRSVAVVPLEIDGTTHGAFTLGSRTARQTSLRDADINYMRLATSLLASGMLRARHVRQLDTLAFSDRLTGLPNRVQLDAVLAETLDAAAREDFAFAVHFIDLDRFKAINDSFGHATGDAVLRIAAARMKRCVRSQDTVARLGGDEFVVVQRPTAGRYGASVLADRLIDTLRAPFSIDGRTHTIGASIGVALYKDDGSDAATLLARADEALYRAKRGGRNRLEFAVQPNVA